MFPSLDRLSHCALMALSLALAAPASALPEDRQQPIRIVADEALRDQKRGFTRYQGNVKLDQGSLHIQAEQITVWHEGEQADKVLATGTPARLRQQPEPDKGPIHAQANTIEYYKSEDRVRLEENASIEQDGAIVTGDSIDYFIGEQLVKAGSDGSDQSRRVQVVIPPAALEQNQEADRGPAESQ